MTTKELIRQKIDAYYTEYKAKFHQNGDSYHLGIIDGLDMAERILDTLEEPVSEEDEDMLNSCISSIEEAKENRYAYKETDGDTSYDHEIAWLKSLRPVSKESLQPHWKPSEEQMEALLKAVDKARELHYTSIDGYDGYNELRSLYEQIKKLM